MLATRFPFTSKGKKAYEISNGHLFVPLINLSEVIPIKNYDALNSDTTMSCLNSFLGA